MNEPTIRHQTKIAYTTFPPKSILLYGEPKTGKTTTAAQFPNALVLNVASENGVGEIEAAIADITTPGDLLEIAEWFKSAPREYETIVLDGLSTFVFDEIARNPSRDLRQSIGKANGQLLPALHAFLALPCIRVITAHAKHTETDIEIENQVERYGRVYKERRTYTKNSVFPDLPPRLRLFVEGRVDAFGYCYGSSEGKSKCWWLPYDNDNPPRPRAIAAGNRLGLPRSTELSYDAIRAAILKEEQHD